MYWTRGHGRSTPYAGLVVEPPDGYKRTLEAEDRRCVVGSDWFHTSSLGRQQSVYV